MPDIVQIKRGLKENLPETALEGELMLCTDTKEIYVGINGEVKSVAMESDIIINTDIPVPQAIGGIQKGEVFQNVSLLDVFMKMLYPYTPPLIMINTNQPAISESGISLTNTLCTIKATRQMHDFDVVKLYRDNRLLYTWSDLMPDFSTPLTLLYADSVPLIANTTYRVEVIDEKQTTQVIKHILFELPVYLGTCSNKTPTSTEINNTAKRIQAKANFSHRFTTTNQRMMLVYPQSWGALSSIKDQNQFEILNTFERSTIQHTTAAGTNAYYAYTSSLTTLQNFNVFFSF